MWLVRVPRGWLLETEAPGIPELVMLASRTGIRKAIKMGPRPPSLEMLSFPGGGQMGADQAVWLGRPRGHHHTYTQDEGPTTSTNICTTMKAAVKDQPFRLKMLKAKEKKVNKVIQLLLFPKGK